MATTKKTTKATKPVKAAAVKAAPAAVKPEANCCDSSCCATTDNVVLSFEKALTPVIWQLSMSDLQQAAFEISRPENENWVLTLRSGRGDLRVLAEFRKEAQAKEALGTVNAVLTGKLLPQGKTKCTGFSFCRAILGFFKFLLITVLLIAVAGAIFFAWDLTKPVFIMPDANNQAVQSSAAPAPAAIPSNRAAPTQAPVQQAPTGVPLSADELLD